MAQKLGNLAVGSIVKINENGSPVEYKIAQKGKPSGRYDNSCNGIWVKRRYAWPEILVFANVYDNSYKDSFLNQWLNSTFFEMLDDGIKAKIKQVKIPYYTGTDHTTPKIGSNGLRCKVFLLSVAEIGIEENYPDFMDGNVLSIYDPAMPYIDGNPKAKEYDESGAVAVYWTRTPYTFDPEKSEAWVVYSNGTVSTNSVQSENDIFQTFILPDNLLVNDDGTIDGTLFYIVPSFTVPAQAMTGQSIPLAWGAAEEATTYVLERKANTESDWTQIYSGANLSYTDTAGSWTSVQYRVKAGDGTDFGDYVTSAAIPVVSASALVISGEDEDLGTITGDLTYTVISDTGNPITLERRVNGRLVAKGTVNSGFSYPISVFDLPTGAGTIELSASVTSGSAPVTATRTWTYTKTPVTFPEEGGPAVLTQDGQNIFPATLAEAVRVPEAMGGSLDKALELLAPLLNSAVISVGTYTGTGTFGADNPSTLTFDSAPSIVTIYGGGKTLAISSTDTEGTAYIDGTSAKWYADTAENQLNVSGTTYSYIAIGEVTES